MMSRDDMIGNLSDGICRVEFTKVSDGTMRVMYCTLNGSLIPADKFPDNETRAQNESVIRCFDVEKQEFRSFRVDSVSTFNVGVGK